MEVKAGPPVTQLPIDTGETAPKRPRGRPRGSRTRPDAPSRASLETRIAGMLILANSVVYFVPGLARDALDPTEITALAKAIDSQARQSPRFRRYIEAALTAGSGGQLFGVMAIIGMRRASRHGLLPPEIDGTLGAMLANQPTPPAPPAVQTEPEVSRNGNAG